MRISERVGCGKVRIIILCVNKLCYLFTLKQ